MCKACFQVRSLKASKTEYPVAPGEWRLLCVPVGDDQLLAKDSVLEHQLCLAAGQVEGGSEDGGRHAFSSRCLK